MKTAICFTLGVLVVAATGSAQTPAGGQKISFAQGLQRSYAGIKTNLNEAASKMAEGDYAYTPSPEIRTFAGQLGHVAFWNYVFCSAAKGEANPNTEELEKTKTAKAEVVKALADSFAIAPRWARVPPLRWRTADRPSAPPRTVRTRGPSLSVSAIGKRLHAAAPWG